MMQLTPIINKETMLGDMEDELEENRPFTQAFQIDCLAAYKLLHQLLGSTESWTHANIKGEKVKCGWCVWFLP